MRPNYIPKESYLGDGSTSQFTFGFKIVNKAHLLVLLVDTVTGLTLWETRGNDTTYFTTTLNTDGTGRINTVAIPTVGQKIVLLLADDSPTQPAKFTGDDRYDLKKIENALDTLAGQIQRMRYLLDRSFKIPEGFTADFASEINGVVEDSVLVMEQDAVTFEWGLRSAPRGEFIGPDGPMGPSPVLDVNPVVTDVDYDQDGAVTIDNTNPLAPILSFTLRAGPQGPQGESTVLVTATNTLPDNGIGADGDMWFVFNIALPEHGNVYQKTAGVYTLRGNIQGPPGGVDSFNGRQGPVVPQAGDYDKTMVGLGNVDNTSDLDKPVSTATQTALDTINTALAGKQNSLPGGTDGQHLVLAGGVPTWDDQDPALPPGGTTGQILTKASATDGDATWQDPSNTGIISVADFTELMGIPDPDRYDGMIAYQRDEQRNWQLRGGIDNNNWIRLDQLAYILYEVEMDITNGMTLPIWDAQRTKYRVIGTAEGHTFTLEDPTRINQEIYIQGTDDEWAPTLLNGGNVISNGDITFTYGRIEMFIADGTNWVRVGGW